MTTPQALREAVVEALQNARGGFADADVDDEKLAVAAIRVVLDAAVAVCRREFVDDDPNHNGGVRNCMDAISALRPESGEGER